MVENARLIQCVQKNVKPMRCYVGTEKTPITARMRIAVYLVATITMENFALYNVHPHVSKTKSNVKDK